MSRKAGLLILALSLVLVLGGCSQGAGTAKVADDRIIGTWSSADGAVTFYPDGTMSLEAARGGVNAENGLARYEMPKKDRIVLRIDDKTRYFDITFKGSSEHSVRETDGSGKSLDAKPIVYTRIR